jgi:hypothetical protein
MDESIWLKDPTEHEILVKPGKITEERNSNGKKRVQKVCRKESAQN